MKKVIKIFLSLLMVLTIMTPLAAEEEFSTNAESTDLVLYPKPRSLEIGDGTFTLVNGEIETDKELGAISKLIEDAKTYAGVDLTSGGGSSNSIVSFTKDDTLHEQGYSLVVDENGIKISYKDDEGAKYAVITLYQIMFQKGNQIPYLTINDDYPDFKYRGFMVDISRNRIPTVETMKTIIDIGESLKMNQLFLYFEGISYRYTFRNAYERSQTPLTPEEGRQIDEYAVSKDITVIPVQNSLGHSYEWVQNYNDLGDLPTSDVLNVYSSETQEMLKTIYSDLAEAFKGEFLSICGDETFNLQVGNGGAVEKAWREENSGNPTNADLYLSSMEIINNIANENKRVMYWADMVVNHNSYDQIQEYMQAGNHGEPIIMDWGYWPGYEFEKHAKIFEEKNMPFYVCPGDNSWSTIVGNTEKTRINAEEAALAGKNHGAIGYMMTNWGDYGHFQNIITQYPAIAYAGGLSWCYDENVYNQDSTEMPYDAFLNTFVYKDTTNTLSQAFSDFANFPTKYDLYTGNANYHVSAWIENAGSTTELNNYINRFQGATREEKRNNALLGCEDIIKEANEFLMVLDNANIQATDGSLLYQEFQNTARQTIAAMEYISMRLRLLNGDGVTAISTKEQEGENALKNSEELSEMLTQFEGIWRARDKEHRLSSTIATISQAKSYYQGMIGLEIMYPPTSEDNLFYLTPENINTDDQGRLIAEEITVGTNWAESGSKSPSLVGTGIGNDDTSTIKDSVEKGLFKIIDSMENVEGKVFVHDTQVANENNLNLLNNNYPFLYFPGIMPTNGVYQITAKLKFEQGTPVSFDTIHFNAVMTNNDGNRGEGNQGLVETRSDTKIEFSPEPDANGWYDFKVTFTNDDYDYRAISADIKPRGVSRDNNDKLYINNLVMTKVEDIIKPVEITTGHNLYNTIPLNSTFKIPSANTSDGSALSIQIIYPDGTKSAVNISDVITANSKGIYRVEYKAEGAPTLVIVFEVRDNIDNLFDINDDTAEGIVQIGSLTYNPYNENTNGFNPEMNLISLGDGATEASEYAELLDEYDGSNGQVVHLFTHNLNQGAKVPLVSFSANVEPGKTYVISARMKFVRDNMAGFDPWALETGLYWFSNSNTSDSSIPYGNAKWNVMKTLNNNSPDDAAKLTNGDWFNYSYTVEVPEECEQVDGKFPTTGIRYWFSTSAVNSEGMDHNLWIDDVAITEVKEITEIIQPQDIEVEQGTLASELPLPLNVSVILNDGSQIERPVIWSADNYDGNTTGTYIFKGQVGINDVVTNPNGLKVEIKVNVKEASTPEPEPEKPSTPDYDWEYRPSYDDKEKDESKEYTTQDRTNACVELLGKGWEYDESGKHCIYTLDANVPQVPNTATK